MKLPKFESYACIGDRITWSKDGFDFTARLEADYESHVNDYECYSPIKIKQWKNDEWFFVGVVISVSKNDVEITDNAASLWGVECNFNRTSNKHLSEVAKELESEAIDYAKYEASRIVGALA